MLVRYKLNKLLPSTNSADAQAAPIVAAFNVTVASGNTRKSTVNMKLSSARLKPFSTAHKSVNARASAASVNTRCCSATTPLSSARETISRNANPVTSANDSSRARTIASVECRSGTSVDGVATKIVFNAALSSAKVTEAPNTMTITEIQVAPVDARDFHALSTAICTNAAASGPTT